MRYEKPSALWRPWCVQVRGFTTNSTAVVSRITTCCFGQIDPTVESFAVRSMGFTRARSIERIGIRASSTYIRLEPSIARAAAYGRDIKYFEERVVWLTPHVVSLASFPDSCCSYSVCEPRPSFFSPTRGRWSTETSLSKDPTVRTHAQYQSFRWV